MAGFDGGYVGWLLDVDLSAGEIQRKPLRPRLARDYVGTRGISAKLLWDNVGPDVDPLGPDNWLIFATGPLTGTAAPATAQFIVGGKSPLTGIIGYAVSGGHWGYELKSAGYDVVVVRGKADRPTFIWIDDDHVELRDATRLWGKDVREANRLLRQEIGDEEADAAVIGPAGERLVKISSVFSSTGHVASRGMGALMGSKNLKAIAVRGTQDIKVAQPEQFAALWREVVAEFQGDEVTRHGIGPKLGTTFLLRVTNEMGALGTRNFQLPYFDRADRISGETLRETYLKKTRGCFACPICCDRFSVVGDGPYKGAWVEGPEYATLHAFGSRLGNDDLAAIIRANELCDQYGLDIYSTGGVIGFAMELYEKGILGKDQTDGIALEWGDCDAILAMIQNIGERRGLGDLLADGVKEAARVIGGEANYYALQMKGAEWVSKDPRGTHDYGLGNLVCNRGADANYIWSQASFFSPQRAKEMFGSEEAASPVGTKGMGKLGAWLERAGTLVDLMGVCKLAWQGYVSNSDKIGYRVLNLLPRLYASVTGFEADADDLLRVVERVITLERAYNIRERGLNRRDDELPARFREPMPAGPRKGEIYNQDHILGEYYDSHGWDKGSGWPTQDSYAAVGLRSVAQQLAKLGRLPSE